MTAVLDERRKRILYRGNHRGMKEADVMLGGFVTAHVATLSDEQLDRLEALLDELDVDIMDWVIGKKPVPAAYDTDIFGMILAYKPYE
ncbi:FAD assembly factor SdhE [Insolitispirillum peregrinum]|uniref:FAD assembly factor SdhE n=1 Tax=Insolitispirillum peregrinum TaxID=80876 RepID=A0A1N7IQ81_9PROT|nr:succinate dehydrogenase assembly factor 2 [Insolitispirillum peregrinum]SIS39245.1 antitoxin CptB [Insolitispirillum peregrinum]